MLVATTPVLCQARQERLTVFAYRAAPASKQPTRAILFCIYAIVFLRCIVACRSEHAQKRHE